MAKKILDPKPKKYELGSTTLQSLPVWRLVVGGRRGMTGRMMLPNDESCGMK
jgi:hypothetical protein